MAAIIHRDSVGGTGEGSGRHTDQLACKNARFVPGSQSMPPGCAPKVRWNKAPPDWTEMKEALLIDSFVTVMYMQSIMISSII